MVANQEERMGILAQDQAWSDRFPSTRVPSKCHPPIFHLEHVVVLE